MHHSEFRSVTGASVFHCIEGHISVKTVHREISLKQGQLIFLGAGVEHALIGVEKSIVLFTSVFYDFCKYDAHARSSIAKVGLWVFAGKSDSDHLRHRLHEYVLIYR